MLKGLRDKRAAKIDAAKSLFDKVKGENRSFTPEEKTQYDNLIGEIDVLKDDIARAERQEQFDAEIAGRSQPINNHNTQEQRDLNSYSMLAAVRTAMMGGQPQGLYAEMHQEAEKEARQSSLTTSGTGILIPELILNHRAVTATGQTATPGDQGGVAISTELRSFIDQLRATVVLASLGADFQTGLVGNLEWPEEDAVFAPAWTTENGESQESTPTFKKKTLSPNRLAGFMDVSQLILKQTSPSIEARLRNQMIVGVALAMDRAGINGSGSGEEPTGILNTSGILALTAGANGGLPTHELVVKLRGKVDANNALLGSLGYLTNTNVRTQLQLTKKDEGSGLFVWGDNDTQLGGYKAGVSNLVPSNLTKGTGTDLSPLIFGNFADLMIGMWGGLEILPDPYTQARKGFLRMHINTFADVLVMRAKSFAAVKDLSTPNLS